MKANKKSKHNIPNITNITKGQVVPNYKELCKLLQVKCQKANSKTAQIKEFKRYFDWKTEGQKIIITDIYNTVLAKEQKNYIPYIYNIQMLLLDLMVKNIDKYKLHIPKASLFQTLHMINSNYIIQRELKYKLAKESDIHLHTVEEFFESTYAMMERNVATALKILDNKRWLTCKDDVMFICINEADEMGNIKEIKREATEQEEIMIREIEYFTCVELGCFDTPETIDILNKHKQNKKDIPDNNDEEKISSIFHQLYKRGLWNQFSNIMTKKLKERNIIYYYYCYKIMFSPRVIEHVIKNEYEKIQQLNLPDEKLKQEQRTLNAKVIERIYQNMIKKRERTISSFESKKESNQYYGKWEEYKYLRRKEQKYIDDFHKLIEMLIKTNDE